MNKPANHSETIHRLGEFDEELISFNKLSRRLSGNIHVSVLHRWAQHGKHGIKLDFVAVERQRRSSVAAVRRFLHRVQARN